jgi:hypothetical protein
MGYQRVDRLMTPHHFFVQNSALVGILGLHKE